MAAYVARPQEEGHSGVIVLQEAFGVNSHIRDVTERLAREGYVAIAPELFHRTAPGFEGRYDNFASVVPHMKAVTMEAAEPGLAGQLCMADGAARREYGRHLLCGLLSGGEDFFSGEHVLPLHATASFYGGGIAQELLSRAPDVKAPMLLVWGGLDNHIKPEHRGAVTEALTASGKEYVNVEFSDADHAFFCDERPSYNARAAEQAWVLLLEFFRSE